jgi:hypothetical protein
MPAQKVNTRDIKNIKTVDSIPEWQKQEVLQTIATTKLEDYIAWEDVKAKHFKSALI